MTKPTDMKEFMQALGNGATEPVLAQIISNCASSVLQATGKKNAKVDLSLTISRLSEESEDTGLKIEAKVSFVRPTTRGKVSEEETRDCVMYYTPQTGVVETKPKLAADVQFQNGMPVGIHARGS